ncbi:metallophosphoesterase [Leptospira sp. 96542]|nr:metallophosphoesterase [Leptospira sp. 96542]
MKIIHISDLHFPKKLPVLGLRGKAIVGYLNYRLRRNSKYPLRLVNDLVRTIQSLDYDALVISGDLTNVSHPSEFLYAKELLTPILDHRCFMIPGNHDRYQKKAIGPNPLFESVFGEWMGDTNDSDFYLRTKMIKKTLFVGWDSNSVLPIAKANGYVNEEVIQKTLDTIRTPYVLVCHHPIWNPKHQEESFGHRMTNRRTVVEKLKSNPPILYLHGHTHTNWIKKKGESMPYWIVNSASSTRLADRKHESGFHQISINSNIEFKRYLYQAGKFAEVNPILYEETDGVV